MRLGPPALPALRQTRLVSPYSRASGHESKLISFAEWIKAVGGLGLGVGFWTFGYVDRTL